MSIQMMLLGTGAVAKKTYVDDIFSTYLFTGTGSPKTITNGVDFAGEGGMVWVKSREQTLYHSLMDTERGGLKAVFSNANLAEDVSGSGSSYVSSFNNNGVSLGTWGNVGGSSGASGKEYATWSFRKAPGFFDVVTYTGNSSTNQTISHNLGCIPGSIWVKCTSNNLDWSVYHRSLDGGYQPETHVILLNTSDGESDSATDFADTAPTATQFTVGSNLNDNGWTYVVYLFAGGESTAATANSVEFNRISGDDDHLSIGTSSDLSFGTGDYTVEFWFNADAINDTPLFENRVSGVSSDTTGFTLTAHGSTNGVRIWWNGASRINGGGSSLNLKQWHHLAATRSSGTTYLFLDGTLLGTTTDSLNITTTEAHIGGGKYSGGTAISHYYDGKISNVRIIKGTALYTSSFRPPTEPLTNITNTKLLCCNSSSSATGSTVTPGTITANSAGNGPFADADSPFDDPAGFVFGENEDQNVIKCGSYVGNGSSTGPEINLGWEPQWVLIKDTTSANDWKLFDSMRGVVSSGSENGFQVQTSNAEFSGNDRIDFTPTGFKITTSTTGYNADGNNHVFMCLRRSDGYVGKPPELGTSVFAMDTGASSSTIPNFDSGFIVDFALNKWTSTTSDWYAGARLIQGKRLEANTNDEEITAARWVFDSNAGWNDFSTFDSGNQSWMWKRHKGLEVQAYKGVSGNGIRAHNMNTTPEMIWVKNRDQADGWAVFHKDLDTYPQDKYLRLDTTDSTISSNQWYLPPTSTHWYTASGGLTNVSGENYLAMLFASVDGISKCGGFTGNGTGSTSTQTITTGFQPRFIIIKRINDTQNWIVLDTIRGWSSSVNDAFLKLNTDGSQLYHEFGSPTSTGFTVQGNGTAYNSNNDKFIYYAHA